MAKVTPLRSAEGQSCLDSGRGMKKKFSKSALVLPKLFKVE